MAKNRHPLKLLMHLMKTLFLSARGTPIFGIVHSRHGQMFITYLIDMFMGQAMTRHLPTDMSQEITPQRFLFPLSCDHRIHHPRQIKHQKGKQEWLSKDYKNNSLHDLHGSKNFKRRVRGIKKSLITQRTTP